MASPFIKYLSPETRSDAWQIYCTDAGFNDVQPGGPYPPRPDLHPPAFTCNLTELSVGRVLEEFQIVYITGGHGLFNMPGRTAESLEVSRGTAFLLLPGVPHAYRPDPEAGWQEYWIGFDGEYPRQLWREGALGRGSVVFQPGLRSTLIQDFDSVFQEMADESRGFQLRAGALVMHILGSVVTGATGSGSAESAGPGAALSSREGAIFRTALHFMEEHVQEPLGTADILRHAGVGYTRLRDIFSAGVGEPPYEHFLRLKIRRAQSMLLAPEVTVKAVAFSLGFSSPYYFSRLFKRKTGFSPATWRNSSRAVG